MKGHQSGFVLIAVMVAMLLVVSIVLLVNTQGAMDADQSTRGLEAFEADYVAQASLQHALWRNANNACAGDVTIPATTLGGHTYSATLTGGGTTTAYSLTVDQDSWIRDDQPTTNKGGDSSLHIKESQVEQPLYRFDLSSLPAGAQINSAMASFYVSGEHPEGPVTVHRITAAWNEGDVTWDSIGASVDSQVLDMIPAQPDQDVRVHVNLTAQVQAWVNGEPNNGILLASTAPGIHAMYVSREGAGSEQPRLDVVVGTAPASPVNIQASGTLANGVTRTLSRPVTQAVQSPSTLVLQPDGAAGTDAYIWEWYKTTNFGNDDETWVSLASNSTSRSLFTFNLAGVPAGSKILSATLSLHHESGNNADVPITAHRISNPWNEAFVTWNRRDNGINWDTAGGDFDAAIVSTTDVGPASNTRYEWDIASLVQDWIDGAPNYGVALATARNNSTGERFYTSDETDPTRHPRLTIEYACDCGSACMAPQGAGNVLMVVVNPTTLVPADATKKALFESWGYTVNVISESANAATYASEAANNDVVFISETVNSNGVGTKLVDLSIGVVSQDGDYNSDLGFAGGSSWPVSPAISVTDASHYITSNFPAGPLDIYSGGMEQLTVSGGTAAGLQTLATTSGAGSLVVLDAGAITNGGSPGAGRRVMLPLGRGAGLNWDYLNGNGRLIIQRALQWGTGNTAEIIGSLLLVVGNAGSPSSKDSDRQALMESWGYTVTLIDDGDSQANFNTAMAANDVVYVTDGVSEPTLVDKVTNTTTPVVNEKGSKLGNFGFSSVESGTVDAESFTGTDAAHYITEPFSGSPVTVFTSSLTMGVPSGTLAPDLQNTGEVSGTPALATLEDGATLWNGGSAPARRVHLPLGAAEITQLTADGQTIMKRAIEWALGANTSATGAVLMVVSDPNSPVQAAADRKTLIESWGYTVTLINDDDTAVNFAAAIDAAEVIYVGSGTTATSNVIKMLDDTTKGVVNEPASLATTMGIASNTTVAFAVDQLTGVDPSHSITQGMPDPVTVFTSPLVPAVLSGTLSPDLQDLAGFLGAPAVAVLESGATRHDVGITAGRRAQLPFATAAGSDLTADGDLIVQRALEWAAAAGEPLDYKLLLVAADPSNLTSAESARKALLEAWGLTVTLIDDSDSQANFDTAAAANDVAYIAQEIDHAAIGTKLRQAPIGVVNEKVALFDELGFASLGGTITSLDGTNITDNTHYITSGFDLGDLTIVSPGQQLHNLMGTLSPDLIVLSDRYGVTLPALAVLDVGADLYGAGNAPARRVWLPWGGNIDGTFPIESLNGDGRTIMKRAIEWAAGAEGGGGGGGGGVSYIEKSHVFTIANANTWQTVDLSIPGVPPNAVVEVAMENASTSREREAGLRALGSAGQTYDLHEAEGSGVDALVVHVQADASGRIQAFAENTNNIRFRLLGYWTGATYTGLAGTFTSPASGSWQSRSLSSYGVSPGQVVEIVIQNTSSSSEYQAGVRKTGSGNQRVIDVHEAESGGKDFFSLFVEAGADASASIEVYAENSGSIAFNVAGAWDSPPGTYFETGGAQGSPVTASAWHQADPSLWGIPPDSVAQFAISNEINGFERELGMRAVGSNQNRVIDLQEAEAGGANVASFHVNIDGNTKFEIYSEAGTTERYFYPLGWWVLN